ncbi:hypothetical protein DCMF_24090 [Candidatus Formimonas warabiya]|uniref:Uncharacterized protein n=1 Tax=Formimonas warabiya TaxID=1761012 RepID=A0A3G1KY31_FORW1|nr:hypothetical protein DCMF_24090 [Candidatus Formimonas warabiya]
MGLLSPYLQEFQFLIGNLKTPRAFWAMLCFDADKGRLVIVIILTYLNENINMRSLSYYGKIAEFYAMRRLS